MNLSGFEIHLITEPEGGYRVIIPALPGCITYGETIDEAIEMAKDAINLYCEEMQSRTKP